ncbi:MAG: hypothetical protein J2P54_05040 [Bradyrhizobiaceae bacterium]|nr:hypothetical protein [Bradyrhizobiaceae bacterium]
MSLLKRMLGCEREKVEDGAPNQKEDEMLVNAYATVRVLPSLDFPLSRNP